MKDKVQSIFTPILILFILLEILACDDQSPAQNQTTDLAQMGDQKVVDIDPACPSAYRCQEGNREKCENGNWQANPCDEGQVCSGEGICGSMEERCEPNQTRCQTSQILETCNENGQWETSTCDGGCQVKDNLASCVEVVCVAGQKTCRDSETVLTCNAEGTGYTVTERCQGSSSGKQCDLGECVPICTLSEKIKTNVGCDYWAVDLDNAFVQGGDSGFLDAAAAPYAVVISNTHPEFTGEVSVFNNEMLVDSAVIPPLGLHIFYLPRRDVDGTLLAPLAYRIRSSIPIVAYQFNPLENENVFSNDASLLLPSHVLGKTYRIMTREQTFDQLRGYLTVVGINEEPTRVKITVTAPTQADPVGMIPALNKGETFEVTLNLFDVLNIQTREVGADLTGSYVEASQNIVVFGGSEAANVPNTNHCINIDATTGKGVCEAKPSVECEDNRQCNDAGLNTCCADHLEEQLFPINTWGKHYIATKSFDRGLEDDYWRIMAAFDNTKIETFPPQEEIPILNAGDWFEFGSRDHFEIISDRPIMVAQFLASEDAPFPNINGPQADDADIGDPSMILAVPQEQFRKDFIILAPNKYAQDYISVIMPTGAEAYFDDSPITNLELVGDGLTWQIARFVISDGVHFIVSDVPVGIIIYGYDDYVSYGYPGGLNLNVVNPETGEVMLGN